MKINTLPSYYSVKYNINVQFVVCVLIFHSNIGIILNEIVVSDDISEEFIELKGDYNTTLDDYTLVFYKSSDKTSIWDLPLTGYKLVLQSL